MKISVLLHEREARAAPAAYVLWPMCDAWREMGHEVEVLYGPRQPIRGDLVFLHVDLTVMPPVYLDAVAGHPRVVNRRLVDISKTSFSRNRVRSPEEWDAPVIIKTVLNSGGHPERRLSRTTLLGRLRDVLLAKWGALSLTFANSLDPAYYPIYPSAKAVPRSVYRNPALFVERFLPERDGELYCVRTYTFLGDHHYCERLKSASPVVKRPHIVEQEPVATHDAMVAARKALGLDYGKLDYVLRDGEAVLLDVNRTPTVPSDELSAKGRMLAPGIEALLR